MSSNIQELKQSITPQEQEQMRRLEGLISLKAILAEDRKNILEYIDEILEERGEIFCNLDVSDEELKSARDVLLRAYDGVTQEVERAKFKVAKMAA